MRISALVFDLDGTAIPNKSKSIPSKKVIEAVGMAKDKIFVSIATGRRIISSIPILEALKITTPVIVSGGTQIYDPVKKKILWEKNISQETVKRIIEILKPYPYWIYISDNSEKLHARDIKITKDERIIYLINVSVNDVPTFLDQLSQLPEIVAHKVKSYTDNCSDIHITHQQATKKNAMQELLRIIKVPQNEVMVVGDGDNDLPLFEAAGFRVAMGNGSDSLKKEADYIAPGVEENGLVQVIEQFIFNRKMF